MVYLKSSGEDWQLAAIPKSNLVIALLGKRLLTQAKCSLVIEIKLKIYRLRVWITKVQDIVDGFVG